MKVGSLVEVKGIDDEVGEVVRFIFEGNHRYVVVNIGGDEHTFNRVDVRLVIAANDQVNGSCH